MSKVRRKWCPVSGTVEEKGKGREGEVEAGTGEREIEHSSKALELVDH